MHPGSARRIQLPIAIRRLTRSSPGAGLPPSWEMTVMPRQAWPSSVRPTGRNRLTPEYGRTIMALIDRRIFLGLGGAAALGAFGLSARSRAAEDARALPEPTLDPAGGPGRAVLAGGCFWGVQGVFQHTAGVTRAVSGYAGGDQASADYHTVSGGRTGHAEAVEVTFDPAQVTFGQLLQVFFSVAHDPTQLNHQGPDFGTQYRSAIFPTDEAQARVARAYIVQLDAARLFAAAIATRIEPDRPFFPAEDYHQDYMTLHPEQPYIAMNDLPKVAALRRVLPQRYRTEPVLVAAG